MSDKFNTYKLFDPKASEFNNQTVVNLEFWKKIATTRADTEAQVCQKLRAWVCDMKNSLASLKSETESSLAKSVSVQIDEVEKRAQKVQAVENDYRTFVKTLQRYITEKGESQYHQELALYNGNSKHYRRKVNIVEAAHSKYLAKLDRRQKITDAYNEETDLDRMKDFEKRIGVWDRKVDTQLEIYRRAVAQVEQTRETVIKKSDDTLKAWKTEATANLEFLVEKWKTCLRLLSKRGQERTNDSLQLLTTLDIHALVEDLAKNRTKTHTFESFEKYDCDGKKVLLPSTSDSEENMSVLTTESSQETVPSEQRLAEPQSSNILINVYQTPVQDLKNEKASTKKEEQPDNDSIEELKDNKEITSVKTLRPFAPRKLDYFGETGTSSSPCAVIEDKEDISNPTSEITERELVAPSTAEQELGKPSKSPGAVDQMFNVVVRAIKTYKAMSSDELSFVVGRQFIQLQPANHRGMAYGVKRTNTGRRKKGFYPAKYVELF